VTALTMLLFMEQNTAAGRLCGVTALTLCNRYIVFILSSAGVDPVAKRSMWDVISRIVTTNKECALILTTHSMDECESLSNRYLLLLVLS
jgi:ABC-type multidrug transport system ATPase subunit